MCLSKISEKKVATRPIPVKKVLSRVYSDKAISQLKDGDEFEAVIDGYKTRGHVMVKNERVFLCYNEGVGYTTKPIPGNVYGHDSLLELNGVLQAKLGGALQVGTLKVNGKAIEGYELRTFYRGFLVEMGRTYYSDLVKDGWIISVGLHSYHDHNCPIPSYPGPVMVQCEIPAGAEYYEGYFRGRRSYASNKLKYIKIIES